ncbi:unnamed protein product [Closterium sp. NIES-53]
MPQPRGGVTLADANPDGVPAGMMLTWQQLLAAYRDNFVEASRKQRMAQEKEETRLGRAEAEWSEREGEEGVNGRGSSTFTSDQQEHFKREISQSALATEAVDGRGRVPPLQEQQRDRRDAVGDGVGDERRSLARSLVTEVQAHPLLRHTGQASHPGMLSVLSMQPGVASTPPGTAFMSPEVMSSRYEFPPTPTTPHMPPSPHSPLPHSPLPQLASLSEDFSLSHSSSAAPLSSASQPSQELDSLADLLIRMSLSTGSRHSMGARGFSLDSLARLSESFPVTRANAPSSTSSSSSSSSPSPSPFSSSSSSSARPSSPFPTSSTLAATTPAASPFPSHPSHPSHPSPLIAHATTLLDVVVIITRGSDSTSAEGGEEGAGELGSSLVGSAVRNKGGEGGAGRRGKLTVELAAVRLLQQEREEARLEEGEADREEEEERKEREEGQGKGHDSKGEVERQRKGKRVGEGGLMTVLAEFRLSARKEREELATDAEECSADEENPGEFTMAYPSDLHIVHPIKEVTSTADEVEKLRKDEKDRERRRLRTCCCRVAYWSLIVLAVVIVGLGVAGLVAYLTVSKQQPEVKVEQINIIRVGITKSGGGFLGLENFRLGLSALINVTALVYNPNNWEVEAENISVDVKFFDMNITNVTVPGVVGKSKGGSAELTVPLDIVDAPLATLSPASLLTTLLLHGRAEMRVVVGTAARMKYWGISSPRVMVHVECTMQLDPFSAKKYNEQCTPSISL